jgi:hypothetical protein
MPHAMHVSTDKIRLSQELCDNDDPVLVILPEASCNTTSTIRFYYNAVWTPMFLSA